MNTFKSFLKNKVFLEQDDPMGDPGGAPPMGGPDLGGGMPPMGGGAPPMGGPDLGGGMPPMGGGAPPMGGPDLGSPGGFSSGSTAAGKAPMKIKASNIWDVLEDILSSK